MDDLGGGPQLSSGQRRPSPVAQVAR